LNDAQTIVSSSAALLMGAMKDSVDTGRLATTVGYAGLAAHYRRPFSERSAHSQLLNSR
jgi:hypothetical protein